MEGEYGQEVGNELLDTSQPAIQAANAAVDKAVDKAMDNVMNSKSKAGSSPNANDGGKEGPKKTADKPKAEKGGGNKDADKNPLAAGKTNKNNPNKVAEAADQIRKKGANAAKNAGEAAKNAAQGAQGDLKGMAIDKALDAVTGPKMDSSKTGGELINQTDKMAKEAIKVGTEVARAAAGDPTAYVSLAKRIVKLILIVLGVILGLVFMIIFALKELLGNVISDAITFISEGFQRIANNLNPTVIEEFTMEDQYEILATAFGTEVMYAYEQLLEEVDDEIEKYNRNLNLSDNADYNSWRLGLEYSKANSIIDYNHIIERTDDVADDKKIGMPVNDDGTMTKVYVGGFTSDIEYNDADFVDGYGPSNYATGVKKDANTYMTGTEPYFDVDRTKDDLKSTVAYAAVSDIAYLVSGYTVSMNEDPIIDLGKEVSAWELGVTVISYEMDIQSRLFQHASRNGGLFEALVKFGTEKISNIFGETTYFQYDPSKIQVKSEIAKREVYGFTQGQVFELTSGTYTCTVSYSYPDTESRSCSEVGCTTEGCTSSHEHTVTKYGSQTVTVDVGMSELVDRVTSTSYSPVPTSEIEDRAKAKVSVPSGGSITGVSVSGPTGGQTKYCHKSSYSDTPTEVEYTRYYLDVPMNAFDVDRMMKAIFEMSVYYGEIDSYYTDREAAYGLKQEVDYTPVKIDVASGQDEVLNKYGKYIGEWKYAYEDKEIVYDTAPGGSFTMSYTKGDRYDNGIDKQPYFNYDDHYIYDCFCDPNYGITKACPVCGARSSRSNEITNGDGDRPVSSMTSPLVERNVFAKLFGNGPIGVYLDDVKKKENQKIKQQLMIVKTTYDKLILDDYTGEMVGGNMGTDTSGGGIAGVVLETTLADGTKEEYYPITVEDRILAVKSGMVQTLENCDYIQNLLAKTGLTYGERLDGSGGNSIDVSPLASYITDLVVDGSYTAADVDARGDWLLGVGSFREADADELINDAISKNPDKFAQLCEAAGLTEEEFKMNWRNAAKTPSLDTGKYKSVIQGLLAETEGKQRQMYGERVNAVTSYLREQCQITEPATLSLIASAILKMGIKDPTLIGRSTSLALFNQNIILASINAGVENSYETAKDALRAFAQTNNEFATPALKSSLETIISQIDIDKANDDLPYIVNGEVPENLAETLEFAYNFVMFARQDNVKKYTHYSQGGRKINEALWQQMEELMATGRGNVTTDCSAFVATLYWSIGYSVPTSSGSWVGNKLYPARTDWDNIMPGDVIVYRKTDNSSGHVEIYYGNGYSLGYGSAPPTYKLHTDVWKTKSCTKRFYRVTD